MNSMKRFFYLLTPAILSLALLAGCGSSDRKWRDTDVIDGYGRITRNGQQIDVCVCHDQKAVYLYYDDEKHALFDTATLPTDEIYDDDRDWLLGNISFDDFNDDGNSDLRVYLSHSDMSESYIMWLWEDGEGFVYQPDDSRFYYPIVVRDPLYDNEFSIYEGVWLADADNQYDDIYYIEFDRDGIWQLYSGGEAIDDGYLYTLDEGITCVCSYQGGVIDGGYIELDGDQIFITTLDYFSRLVSQDDSYNDDDSGNGDFSWDPELCQRDVSEFEGIWHYDNDLSAETYIIIDGYGNWRYYQRVPGDPEGTEIDCGIFTCSEDEISTYYAESVIYDDVSYRVFEFDEGILIWDEYTYYRMD